MLVTRAASADAPIRYSNQRSSARTRVERSWGSACSRTLAVSCTPQGSSSVPRAITMPPPRSEEHTSELQSRFELVCRLLLEKKKQIRDPDSKMGHIESIGH